MEFSEECFTESVLRNALLVRKYVSTEKLYDHSNKPVRVPDLSRPGSVEILEYKR